MENKFEKLYESLKEAYYQVCIELTTIQKEYAILKNEKTQWENEKIIQNSIINSTVNNANSKNNEYLEENKHLREEIKRLGKLAGLTKV